MIATISAMLVDDHAVVRAGFRMLLAQTGTIRVVGEAERGEEAVALYQEHQPHVVVMDLNLPGLGGLGALQRIVGRDPEARVLMFSIHDELVYVARALEAGARGYITKSCAPELLVTAVERVARGEFFLEPGLAAGLASRPGADPPLDRLTGREFQVFCLLARGYTTREAADELRLGQKTIANYATLIKDKLEVGTTAELVRLAYRHGVLKP